MMSATDPVEAHHRTVKLPLQKIKSCAECEKEGDMMICSTCKEIAYCSRECQNVGWPTHRLNCSKTDPIDISLFYPLIACLIEASRMHIKKPVHPALGYQIVNSPNSTANPVGFPDGSAAKLVILGDRISSQELMTAKWWPTADSPKVRSKLLRRFVHEGYVIPILTAACYALLTEMYTTPNSELGEINRRTRLKYRSVPIADFGIACGRAEVKNQDKLAYLFLHPELSFSKGQDPDKHYWIYFTTARGEELTLDCSMFTFNFCMLTQSTPYCNVGFGSPGVLNNFVPAYFEDRLLKKQTPTLTHESAKFSVLKDPRLQQAARHSREKFNVPLVVQFMEDLAGRACTIMEKELVIYFAHSNGFQLRENLKHRTWTNFPKQVPIAIETDPGEMVDVDREDFEEFQSFVRKWNKRQRRGDITTEKLSRVYETWRDKHSV